ncbi:golgin subfamily A member 6-like protein 22 [Macrobrachium rosenbergii]|uniref:golgin subfamily A member 6-like protein 22 n=1 Tax=Macrobrachium rosenbergii TaxID=79674 RepID=UPI0034D6DB0E
MFSQVKSITVVQNLLALILLGLVMLFIFGSGNFGYIIGKNLVPSLLGGLLAFLYGKYVDDISDFVKEKELLFQELEDAYSRQLSLLDEIEVGSHPEEILAERNEILDKDLSEEIYRVDELFKVIDEYQSRLSKAENENEELREKNEELQDVIIQRNKDVDHLKEELERKGGECATNTEEIQELKTQIMDLAEKESQMVASLETLKGQKSKNEILAEEVLVMKNWVAQLAGEKEKLKDLLVEKELEIDSMRRHMEDQKEKNHVLAEEGQVLKNWIAEIAGENAKLKERLAQKEMEEDAIKKVSEMLKMTEEKVSELESTLKQVQERLKEAEENACQEEFSDDKEDHSQEENREADVDKVNEVEAEFTKENGGHSQEENGEAEELEQETGNQEDVEVTQDKKGSCEEEETKLENEESPKHNGEENNQPRTKKKRGKKRKKPARQEDSRWSLVQSVALQTHSEFLHSIMLPAEFQEVLQKNEKGLAFIKYKNKVLLNFMHHDKASVRAVLSRCSKSTAEEVLVDLQKLVLSDLTKD